MKCKTLYFRIVLTEDMKMLLEKMRKMAGYSQNEFAVETGINTKIIGFYVNGNCDINGVKFAMHFPVTLRSS